MIDLSEVTLIVPTHNRPGYLKRTLSYYEALPLRMIVVDSTEKAFDGPIDTAKVTYNHLPGMSMPMKISRALAQVKTKFVVLCADDDFLIPEGVSACLQFLKENKEFVSAQGNNVSYKKQPSYSSYIEINPMYLQQLSFEITDSDPFARMGKLFQSYRTIFSAVHYTAILSRGFQDLEGIKNLYLNEYLTAIIPILSGYHKELNLFYQVREFSPTSDDKRTDNLDVLCTDTRYRAEMDGYLEYLARIASEITHVDPSTCKNKISDVFLTFSGQIRIDKENMKKVSFTKRMGNLLQKIPVAGKKIVMARRLRTQRQELTLVIKTVDEQKQLERVKKCIIQYASVVD